MDTGQLDAFDSIIGGDLSTYTPPDTSTMSTDFTALSYGGYTPASSGLPSAGLMLGAGASILGGIGSYMQGQEMAGADEYNASLALMQGQFQVEQIGEEEKQTLSTQKAIYAKAGVEQSGSVLDTALSTATQYEYSKEVATFNAQSQANMDEYEAKAAKSQGEMGLAMGLLGGVSKLL